jgi:hypothetical protein
MLKLKMSEKTGGTSDVFNDASTVFEIEIDIPTLENKKICFWKGKKDRLHLEMDHKANLIFYM